MANPVGRAWNLADRGDGRGDMLSVVYYVAADGNDTNPGNQAAPWRTINRVNAEVYDLNTSILFRAGDVFDDEPLRPVSVGGGIADPEDEIFSLTVNRYGTGANPVIRQAIFDQCPDALVANIDFDHNGGTERVLDVQHSMNIRDCAIHDSQQRDGIAIRNCPDNAVINVARCDLYWHLAGSFGTNDDAHGISVRPVANNTITVNVLDCTIHENSGDCIQCDPSRAAGFTANINVNGGTWFTQPLAQNKYGWNAGERPGEDGFDTKVDETVPTPTSVVNLNVVGLTTYGWLTANSPHSNPTPYNLKEQVVADLNRLTIYDSEHALRIRESNRGGSISQPDVRVRNSIVYDVDNAIRLEDGDLTNLKFYNNTFGLGINNFVNKANGGNFGAGFEAFNNAFAGTKPADFTDATNVSASTADGVDFVEPSTNDYRAVEGGVLEDAGADLSGIVFLDYTAKARAQAPGGWEIGAYDGVVSLAPPPPPPQGDFGFYEALVARPGLIFRLDLSTLGGDGPLDAAGADAQAATYGSGGPADAPRAEYDAAFDAAAQTWDPALNMANTKLLEIDNEFVINSGKVFVYWETRFDPVFTNLGDSGVGDGNNAWGDPTGNVGVGGSADGYIRGFKGYTMRTPGNDKVWEIRVQGHQYKNVPENDPGAPGTWGDRVEPWKTGGLDIRQYNLTGEFRNAQNSLDPLVSTVSNWPDTWTRWAYFIEFDETPTRLSLWKIDKNGPPEQIYNRVECDDRGGIGRFDFELNTSELQSAAQGGPTYRAPYARHYGRTIALVDDVADYAEAVTLVQQAVLNQVPVNTGTTVEILGFAPLTDSVTFTFTHDPDGDQVVLPGVASESGTVPTQRWSVDFTPTKAGTWNWTATSATAQLNGATGQIEAIAGPDEDITGMTLDWANLRELAGPDDYAGPGTEGTDNFPVFWSADGHQWTHGGDGGGFWNGANYANSSWIFARLDGDDYQTVVGTNLRGGSDPTFGPQPFTGKSYGGIEIGGVIYMPWGPGSGGTAYNETRLIRSLDAGDTWEQGFDWTTVDDTIIKPTIMSAGQGNAGAGSWSQDGFVYLYFIRREAGATDLQIMDTGIDLARVLPQNIWDETQYEWWNGSGWTSDPLARDYVFTDPFGRGVGWNCSVSYLQPQNRYVLTTEHTNNLRGNIDFWQAPSPTGPWTRFAAYGGSAPEYFGEAAGYGARGFYANFSAKWLNGNSGVLVYTGTQDMDLMGMVPFTFTTG